MNKIKVINYWLQIAREENDIELIEKLVHEKRQLENSSKGNAPDQKRNKVKQLHEFRK